jgi:branched-chain amino acid transport system permease protein
MNILQQLLQIIFSGITVGAVYTLSALGWAIVHNVARILNWTLGEFFMFSGMSVVWLVKVGFPLPLAIVSALAMTILVGILVERLALRPAKNADVLSLMLITLGASMVIRGGALFWWGHQPMSLEPFTKGIAVSLFGASVPIQSLWVIGIGVISVAGLMLFFDHTVLGKALRSCAIDREASRLMGISPESMGRLSFILAAGLGAIGGIIITPLTFTSFDVGMSVALKGLVVAVIGGWSVRSIPVMGILVGVLEYLVAGFLSAGVKDAVALVILIGYLLARTLKH